MRAAFVTASLLACMACMIAGCSKQERKSLSAFSKSLKVQDCLLQGDLISGTARNTSDKTLTYVEIDFALYDAKGERIGTTTTNTTNIQPNSSWNFEAYVTMQNVSKAEIAATRAY